MIAPNLSERIAWYQERLRPEDSAMGNGIADWTITAEYRSGLEVDGSPIWGCMCSPSMLPDLQKLTADDIAAKRAHIIIRMPENADDLAEVERTLLHELGHVLVAPMQSTNREAEENAMHSFDHFFSKLSPEQGAILARAMQNPMARAYRAKEKTMPDMEDKKDKPDKEAPKMQEGAPRDIPTISADIANADPSDTALLAKLAIEYRQALIAEATKAMGGNGPASQPTPAAPPEMGMKPEEAYQRKVNAEAVKVFVDMLEVSDDKKAYLRKQPTIAGVKEALDFVGKENAKMGFEGHPAMRGKGDDEPESVFYPSGNKSTMAACRVMARKKDGISARGIYKCSPQEQRETGQLMRFSLTDAYPMLREVAEQNAHRDRKAVFAKAGGDQ